MGAVLDRVWARDPALLRYLQTTIHRSRSARSDDSNSTVFLTFDREALGKSAVWPADKTDRFLPIADGGFQFLCPVLTVVM